MKLVPLSSFSDGDLVRRALKENPHAGPGAIVMAIDLARWSAVGGEWDQLRMSGRTRPAVRLKALEEGYRHAGSDIPWRAL